MKPSTWRSTLLSIVVALFLCPIGWGQSPSTRDSDPVTEEVQKLINQAWGDVMEFSSSAKTNKSVHPGAKWSVKLWQFRGEHSGTPAAGMAARVAIELLGLAGKADEAIALAESLKPTDSVWSQAIYGLLAASSAKGDLNYFTSKAESLLQVATGKNVRANVYSALADAYWEKKELEHAKKLFRAVVDFDPESELAQRARSSIYDIEHLGIGQHAPPFSAKLTNGKQISLQDLKGQVVLLHFYASWCRICMAELPKVKALNEKYKNKGLALLSISLDDDKRIFEKMVAEKGVDWPQVMDGLAFNGDIPKLMNIQSSAVFYLLDREGRIVAKGRIGGQLEERLARMLEDESALR